MLSIMTVISAFYIYLNELKLASLCCSCLQVSKSLPCRLYIKQADKLTENLNVKGHADSV